MMASDKSVKLTKDFIEAYRSHPCLWQSKSKEYSNRRKKMRAYENMVRVSLPHYPEATVDWVKRKIQNMRTVFKKELNKLESSKRSGVEDEDIYVPKLWYFDLMRFTTEEEIAIPSTTNGPQMECSFTPVLLKTEDISTSDIPSVSSEAGLCNVAVESVSTQQSTQQPAQITEQVTQQQGQQTGRRGTKRGCEPEQTEILTRRIIEIANQLMLKEADDCELLGASVTEKMRRLPVESRLEVDRLVNEVLYRALRGEITQYTRLTECPPNT